MSRPQRRSIDELLAAAQARLVRLAPHDAGALVIERTVLEWRLDPASETALPEAGLQDLGITRATDVIGGFRAWKAAGLPVVHAASGG